MLKFDANLFLSLSNGINSIAVILDSASDDYDPGKENRDSLSKIFLAICNNSKEIGLKLTEMKANDLAQKIVSSELTKKDLQTGLVELNNRLSDELRLSHFIHLSESDKNFFEPNEPPFGVDVLRQFPSATFDTYEASMCIGIGRYTASVFHLMRIMEIALRSIYACLNIPSPITGNDKTWGSILQKIRESYRLRPNFGEMEQFQSLHAMLDSVKDAWRNNTMHIEKKYTEEEAKHIFAVVKGFMQKLSSRMNEQGLPLA